MSLDYRVAEILAANTLLIRQGNELWDAVKLLLIILLN